MIGAFYAISSIGDDLVFNPFVALLKSDILEYYNNL